MCLLVNHTKPTNFLYWNQYLLIAGNYKPASGQLQIISVNGAILITINRVINLVIVSWFQWIKIAEAHVKLRFFVKNMKIQIRR